MVPELTKLFVIKMTSEESTVECCYNEIKPEPDFIIIDDKKISFEETLSLSSGSEYESDNCVPKAEEAKSLPLHCIVESVPSLQASLSIDTRNLWKRRPNIETDSYVIIAASTPWSDVVSTALQRLGYSIDIASTARGSLIIKNWKPIPLENISDNQIVPVSDILGELTSVVTLRIVILRTKPSTFGEIKDKLLKLLVLQSHAVLRSTGCPLDEVLLSQICRSSYQNPFPFTGEIPEELRRKFEQWWSSQLSPQSPIPVPKILPFLTAQPNELDFAAPGQVASAVSAGASNPSQHGLHAGRDSLLVAAHNVAENHHSAHHPAMMVHPALHSIHSQYPTNQKTRMRTSFDPEMELPKLQRWFQENPHPSRQQIQSYVIQLNSLESRRGRKPLDVNNVVYWFKNARAAQKRAEVRGQGMGNGYVGHHGPHLSGPVGSGMLMTHSDYMKCSPSMKSEDIDTISQHSDDDDDDDMDDNDCNSQRCSPQLPLSLTMHERNRPSDDSISIKNESNINGDISLGNNNNNIDSEVIAEVGSENVQQNGRSSSCEQNNTSNGDRSSEISSPNDDSEIMNTTNTVENSINMNSNSNNNNNTNTNNNNGSDEQRSATHSPKNSLKSEDLEMDDNDTSPMDDGFRTPSPDPRRDLSFPLVPNSMFSHSIMYMSHYMPGMSGQPGSVGGQHHGGAGGLQPVGIGPGGISNLGGLGGNNSLGGSLNLSNMSSLSSEERRKRNRTFIDPVTEVPKLEQWFALNTHPSHNQILKYTEDLNQMPYRQKFPRLESKNVQFWFKNRRAKCKRLKMSLYDSPQCSQLSGIGGFGHNLKNDAQCAQLSTIGAAFGHNLKFENRD